MSDYDEKVLTESEAREYLKSNGIADQDIKLYIGVWKNRGWKGNRHAKITKRYIYRTLINKPPSRDAVHKSKPDVRQKNKTTGERRNPVQGPRGWKRIDRNTQAGATGDERYRESPGSPRLKNQGTRTRTKSGTTTQDRSLLNLTPAQRKRLRAADKKRKNK